MQNILEKIKSRPLLTVAIVFSVIALALYANTFNNQMFWDDQDGILNNAFIKDWSYFPKFFSENLIAGSGLTSNYWRPLLLTVFSLEWRLWGDNPFGYHLINTLAHLAAALCLFAVIKKIFNKSWLASAASLIFLIHPLQTEAVTYVSGLADPLSALFTLLAIWFWLKFRDSGKAILQSKDYLIAILMYIACLLTKDSAFVAVGAIGLVDYFYQPQNNPFWTKLKFTLQALWPFLAITGIYTLLRATVLNFQNTFNLYNEENLFTSNFHVRLLTFLKVLAIYFGLMFWPNNLHMERTTPYALNFSEPLVWVGSIILLILLYFAFGRAKRYPVVSFGILWFLGLLFPHSNLLVPTAGLLYEHWLYLPMVGIFISVLWLAYEFYSTLRQNTEWKLLPAIKYSSIALLIVWSTVLSAKTIIRNNDWQDPITFYNQTLQYNTTYRVLNNLGMAYAETNDHEMAKITYYRAISMNPEVAVAYHNLGNTYKESGDNELAIKNFRKAIEMQPDFIFSYNALASLYLEDKNYEQTRSILEQLLNNSDNDFDILILLTNISIEERNYQKTVEYLTTLKSLAPNDAQITQELKRFQDLANLEK